MQSADEALQGQLLLTSQGLETTFRKEQQALAKDTADSIDGVRADYNGKFKSAKEVTESLVQQTADSLKTNFNKKLINETGQTLAKANSYTDQTATQIKAELTASQLGAENRLTNFFNQRIITAEANLSTLNQTIRDETDRVLKEAKNYTRETAEGTKQVIARIEKSLPQKIDEKILEDKKIKDTRDQNYSPAYYWENHPRQTVEEFKKLSAIDIPPSPLGGATYGKLITTVPWNDRTGGQIQQRLVTENGDYTRTSDPLTGNWLPWNKEVSRAEYNITKSTVNSFERMLGSLEGDVSAVTQTAEAIRSEVSSLDETLGRVSTQVDQTANSWAVRHLNSERDVITAIDANPAGVRIKGKNIWLDGNTLVSNGVITNAMIANATIKGAKIADATIGSAKIAGLDVDKLTGRTTNFVQSAWNAVNSYVGIDGNGITLKKLTTLDRYPWYQYVGHTYLNGDGVKTYAEDGSIITLGPDGFDVATTKTWSSHLGNEGLELRTNKGIKVGGVTALVNETKGVEYITYGTPDAVGLTAEKGKYVGLYRQITDREDLYKPVIIIGGSSGHIHTFGEWVPQYNSKVRIKFKADNFGGEPVFCIINAEGNEAGIGIGMWSNLYFLNQGKYYKVRNHFSWMS
nr:gp58-like family protein [Aerococcus urinae]